MNKSKNHMLLFAVVAVAFYLPEIDGSNFIISDEQIRNFDLTPMLGHGYRVGSDDFQSSCHMVDDTTAPTYNYDYTFTDLSDSKKLEKKLDQKKLSASFGYAGIKAELSIGTKPNSTSDGSKPRIVVTTMRIERKYSSIKEEIYPMSDDTINLLEKQDYNSFFKSCGPNYVRSIHRVQEVTSIFKFHTTSRDLAQEFSAGLKVQGWGSNVDHSFFAKKKFKPIVRSMEIKILGFGLGLNKDGLNTLVTTSLDEFNKVMQFVFKSIMRTEDTSNIGIVYGVELVPWVDNPAFQLASKLLDENIERALPRSLIPKAIANSGDLTKVFINDHATRSQYDCENYLHHIDKYGYCCEGTVLFNNAKQQYETEAQDIIQSNCVCKPLHKINKSIIKDNMSSFMPNDGKLVDRFDSVIQDHMTGVLAYFDI